MGRYYDNLGTGPGAQRQKAIDRRRSAALAGVSDRVIAAKNAKRKPRHAS